MTTLLIAVLALAGVQGAAVPASPEWFQRTEQALMDAVARGDTALWDRTLDDDCVITSEEGQVIRKAELLKQMRPLPQGLDGHIVVRDLTVQLAGDTAVVRLRADEDETVFGQALKTAYRTTDVFRRRAGAWKMIASHTSVVTADPPAQQVTTDGFARLAGTYELAPNGWTFHVVLRGNQLFGGRRMETLQPMVPMTPTAFVVSGSLGEWLFDLGPDGRAMRIVNLRKFEPLVWTRVAR